jgi:hypothetical protein
MQYMSIYDIGISECYVYIITKRDVLPPDISGQNKK